MFILRMYHTFMLFEHSGLSDKIVFGTSFVLAYLNL
jgi:hypothetical protein